MRISNRIASAACGLLLSATFAASADNAMGASLDDIREQQLELRADAQAGDGVFEDMSGPERQELVERQTRLLAMIEGKSDVAELGNQDQVAAFNLLQEINATINKAEDSQVVCEYIRKVGSHRKTKECKTVAERRRERMEAERDLQRAQNGFCGTERCPSG